MMKITTNDIIKYLVLRFVYRFIYKSAKLYKFISISSKRFEYMKILFFNINNSLSLYCVKSNVDVAGVFMVVGQRHLSLVFSDSQLFRFL